jgi:membrane protease subunit HflK
VAASSVDDVFYDSRARIETESRRALQDMLDADHAGMEVSGFELQDVQPPQSLQDEFADVTKAREEEKAKLADAQAYANRILPQARGEAMRMVQEAEGYRSSVIERAKGDTARFVAALAQYDKAPQVTRKRLYLDAMESILGKTSKVVVDARGGGTPTFYLPLDQLLRQTQAAPAPPAAPAAGGSAPTGPAISDVPHATPPVAEDYRSREREP